jgi:hypothetical protein
MRKNNAVKPKGSQTVAVPGGSRKKVVEYDPSDLEQLANASRRRNLAAQGQAPFFRLPVGTTSFELPKQRVRVETNKWNKEQAVFHIVIDDEDWDLALPLSSSAAIGIAKLLSRGVHEASIVRAGQGTDTQYSLVAED